MKKSLFVLVLLLPPIAFLGNDHFPAGARSQALGNASVTFSDTWSTVHNQAGLGFLKNISAGIYYESRFLLNQLSTRSAALAIPLKTGTLGFSLHHFGYTLYQENEYGFSFAKNFSNVFSIGMALDYVHIHAPEENGNQAAVVGQAGFLIKLRKDLQLGVHIYNPMRSKFGRDAKERVPTIMRLGINYSFSSQVLFVMETEKDLSKKAVFKEGIEYQPLPFFYLRAGISNSPTLSAFGIGLYLKNFQLDLSSNYHPTLGISPQLGFIYQFTKNEKTDRGEL